MPIQSLETIAFSLDAPAAPLRRACVPQKFDSPLQMLRAVVLLGGSVRQSEFRKSIGRSILDLPIDAHRTLLDAWSQHVAHLAETVRWKRPLIRLLIDQRAGTPQIRCGSAGVEVITQHDQAELRGTGGILRDLSDQYDEHDYLLVANAAQILREPLIRSAAALAETEADVSLVAHEDQSPSGLVLVRCGAMRMIRSTGYIDFKEQALPIVAATHSVRVKRLAHATAAPIRSLADFIAALRALHATDNAPASALPLDALGEGSCAVFAIAEDPADVHPTAELYDSVVLRGGRVERGAVVVRSIVCAGAVVPGGVTVLNRVVSNHNAAWASEAPRKSWPFQPGQLNEFVA